MWNEKQNYWREQLSRRVRRRQPTQFRIWSVGTGIKKFFLFSRVLSIIFFLFPAFDWAHYALVTCAPFCCSSSSSREKTCSTCRLFAAFITASQWARPFDIVKYFALLCFTDSPFVMNFNSTKFSKRPWSKFKSSQLFVLNYFLFFIPGAADRWQFPPAQPLLHNL